MLCGTDISELRAWMLPDNSGEIIVAMPRHVNARAELKKLATQGVTVLPGPHNPAVLTTELLTMFACLSPKASDTTRDLYGSIARLSFDAMFEADA